MGSVTDSIARLERNLADPDVRIFGLDRWDIRLLLDDHKAKTALLAEHENAITWDTTCPNCAKLLDASYAETVRAEKAEAEVAAARLTLTEREVDYQVALAENAALRASLENLTKVVVRLINGERIPLAEFAAQVEGETL